MVRWEPQALAGSSFAATPYTRRVDGRVLRFVQQRGVIRPGERVLAAVSGGPDSTAMLLILSRIKERLAFEIDVAHFDHMLRTSGEAEEDETFVRWLAGRLSLPAVCGRGDVAARVRRKSESVEDAARRLRYGFLHRAARTAASSVVLLGHTLDDRAETVILHVLRGSGVDGLVGIAPRSSWPLGRGPDVGRPILELTREETERYCGELDIEPRRDPTNDLLIATRNRVRHELIPKLREFNPRVELALARLAESAASGVDYLDVAGRDAWPRVATLDGGRVSLSRPGLAALHPAVRARVFRRAFQSLLGSAADLEAVHVEAMASLLGKARGRLSLPHGTVAVLTARTLVMRRGPPPFAERIMETALAVPGVTRVGGWRITAEVAPPPVDVRGAESIEAYLDADAAVAPLTVRSRNPGDRLRPLGLGGEKKVQDILVDAGVPSAERDGVPIVCDAQGVVWVVGHRIDERVALARATRRVLHVRFCRSR